MKKQIKDLARQAYRDQQTQDNEGGCGEPIGFIAGFCEAHSQLDFVKKKAELLDNFMDAEQEMTEKELIYSYRKLIKEE